MIYHGHVQDGRIILDGPVVLPEGAEVSVQLHDSSRQLNPSTASATLETLREVLIRYAGTAVELPPDAARNHDHYLYGTPKQ